MQTPRIVRIIVIATAALILLVILPSTVFITIPSGHGGVIYRKFSGGTSTKDIFPEGFHVIAPWNTIYVYDLRFQQTESEMDVLSKNGLSIRVDVSIRYQPVPTKLGHLQKEVGQNYLENIIMPEIRSSTRKIIGKYDPEELYSSKREAIQKEIMEETDHVLEKKFIILDAVLIRSVELPLTIKTAIETKLKQEQESKEYEFRLQKEQKEAERKKIEAQGIKAFQEIVSEGISDKLLKWKGIEATMELSKSSNAKVVIIGSGKDGLPIILGGQ